MPDNYVSRGGLKLASVADILGIDFRGKLILDVGSSTGGFTDYALQHGARKVIAVDSGAKQLHPILRGDQRIELHEKTDIRTFKHLSEKPDIVVIDVSFVSLRDILPSLSGLIARSTDVIAMVKPQFEARGAEKHRGIIKNDHIRRDILKQFERWVVEYFVILGKADSGLAGMGGNLERFYLLRKH